MHDHRSYSDNLSLASAWYSDAMQAKGFTADQGLAYCYQELHPWSEKDELVRILRYAAILSIGHRLGISPLSDSDPFSVELRTEIEACWSGIGKEVLLGLGASQQDTEALTRDIELICRELGVTAHPVADTTSYGV